MKGVRIAFAVTLGVTVTLLACSGDDSSGSGSSQSPIPPNGCPAEPCMVGHTCLQQAEPGCDGTWYCWTDQKWYCQPQDSGGPAGPPPDGAFVEEPPVTTPEASTDATTGG
jgi:hypothetical protein